MQSLITGAFDAIHQFLRGLTPEQFAEIDGRGSRIPSRTAAGDFLKKLPDKPRILVAAATDSSALGVLDAARQGGCESNIAVMGQDCIPDAIEEMRSGKSSLIGSISHEANSYSPRLIQLGVSLLRGYAVPPDNYVRCRVVTPDSVKRDSEGE